MLKALKNKTVIFASSGSVLSLAGVLIFQLLPSSELANGIQHSATDALWVLALSPVFLFIGGLSLVIALFKDMKSWKSTLSDVAIYIAVSAFIATVIFNFAVSLSYFISQYSIGFVAPFTGLIYETLVVIMLVFVLWQFIFSVLTIAETIKESK